MEEETKMRLGKSIEWGEIEIGEVFAADGCLGILEKRSNKTAMVLAVDNEAENEHFLSMKHLVGKILYTKMDWVGRFGLTESGKIIQWFGEQYARRGTTGFYRLDKNIQALWKTE